MKRKGSVLALIILLLFQGMFGTGAGFSGIAQAAPVNPKILIDPLDLSNENEPADSVTSAVYKDSSKNQRMSASNTDNILTKVWIKDKNNTVIDSVYNKDLEEGIELGSDVHLSYEWELPNNHNYQDGSTFEFDIPKAFKIYNSFHGDLTTEDGIVGTFSVTADGHVTMTFNSSVMNSEVRGTLEFKTEISKETVTGSTELRIPFPIRDGEQEAILYIKPEKGKHLEKQGKANQAGSIDWTLNVNTILNRMEQVQIRDQIPEELTLDETSVKVYELDVNIDGSTVRGAEVTTGIAVNTDTSTFTITFDNKITTAYRVEYTTTVDKGDETRFTNHAVLSRNGSQDVEAKDTVEISRGEILNKKVANYDKDTRTIDWMIEYNFREKDILQQDAVLVDRFNNTQNLVPGSLKVKHAGPGGAELPNTNYVVDIVKDEKGKNGFNLSFNTDIDSGYVITYQTTTNDDRIYADENIINTVVANGVTKSANQELKSVILKKTSNIVTDYNNKTTAWEIVINEDQFEMDQVVLTDTFLNEGQELLLDSLKVSYADGKAVDASTYTVKDDELRKGFTVTFNQPIKEAVIVTYTTKFNNDWKVDPSRTEFRNRAHLAWLESGVNKETSKEATLYPDDLTKANGDKKGEYNSKTKEITWTIRANYNKKEITNAIFTDKLEQNQKYVADSLQVYEMTLLGYWNGTKPGKKVDPLLYDFIPPTESNGYELQVKFKDPIDSPYQIEFKTTLDGEVIDKEVSNKGIFLDGTSKLAEWQAKATIPQGGEYVFKKGTQNGEKLEWTIYINRGQSYVEEAKITDVPSSNLILVEDSFHVYETDVAGDGTVSKSQTELVRGQDYELEFVYGEKEYFELSFKNPIDTAYILEYETWIDAADREKVSNAVSFEGLGITTGTLETAKEYEVRMSSGSGTGSGVRGSLEVLKVDSGDESHVLEGATFVLQDKEGKRPAVTLTTNAEGKALFTKLLYGDYILEETSAPEGYVIDKAVTEITMDSSIKQTGNIKQVIVTNSKESTPNPGTPDPGTPDPGTPDPGTPDPGTPDPGTPDPGTPDPGTPNPGTPDPGTPDPGTPDPGTPGPGTPDPGTPGPGTPDPSTPNPGNPSPGPNQPDPEPSTGTHPDKGTPTVPGDTVEPDQTGPIDPGEVVPNPSPVEVSDGEDSLVGNEVAQPDDDANGEHGTEAKSESPIAMLPKTGEGNPVPLQLGGLALMLAGLFLSRLRHKRQ